MIIQPQKDADEPKNLDLEPLGVTKDEQAVIRAVKSEVVKADFE